MSNLLVAADMLEEQGNPLCETLREYADKPMKCGHDALELQREVLEATGIDVSDDVTYYAVFFDVDGDSLSIAALPTVRLPAVIYDPYSRDGLISLRSNPHTIFKRKTLTAVGHDEVFFWSRVFWTANIQRHMHSRIRGAWYGEASKRMTENR